MVSWILLPMSQRQMRILQGERQIIKQAMKSHMESSALAKFPLGESGFASAWHLLHASATRQVNQVFTIDKKKKP